MIIKNIFLMLKSHTLLILLLVFLQIISCVALVFSYAQYKESQFERESYNNKAGQFEIENIQQSIQIVKEKINNIEENCDMLFDCIELYFNEEMTIKAIPTEKREAINYGSDFSQSDEMEAIIPLEMQLKNGLNIGDKVNLLGCDFTIVGVRRNDETEIKYNVLSCEMKVAHIKIFLSTVPTKKEINEISTYINENFSDSIVSLPQERNLAYESSLDSKVLIMALLILLSVVNINFIYEYLIKQRNKINSIYRVCGLNKFRLIINSLFEFAFYTLFSTTIALLLFHLFIKNSLHLNSIVPYDYVIPTIFYIVVSIYSGFEKIIFSLKKDPINHMSEDL